MGGCIGSPRDGSSPNGDSSDGTGIGHSGKLDKIYFVHDFIYLIIFFVTRSRFLCLS